MDSLQRLHTAIGQIAYAVAAADGKIQQEERQRFHDLVAAELRCKDYDFDISAILFQLLDRGKVDAETAYEWAMKEIRLNSHYLSPELKNTFLRTVEKVAKAFPPVTSAENKLIERFVQDMKPIIGDPVYYKSS